MNKQDFFKKYQPVFYKIIEASLKHDHLSHAYLLTGDNQVILHDGALYLTQVIINEKMICEDENSSKRIIENNYADLIYKDASQNSVGKDDIQNIKQQFISSAQEKGPGYKVYWIDNLDLVSEQALNALLLFLENPLPKTVAIFTTTKPAKILETIKSRCQIIKFNRLNEELLFVNYQKKYDETTARFLSYLVNNGVKDPDEEWISTQIASWFNFWNCYLKDNKSYIITLYQELFKEKSKNNLDYFLNFLVMLSKMKITNNAMNSKYQELIEQISEEKAEKLLEKGLSLLNDNKKGASFNLLIDQLVGYLEEINE